MKGLMLLGVMVAFGAIMYFVVKSDAPNPNCPDHWHVGFDVYYQDAADAPVRVDFASPRWNNNPGLAYYEWGNGPGNRAGGMSAAVHLHMGGSGAEAGVSSSQNQFHLEDPGRCVGVSDMLRAGDVALSSDSMKLSGGHDQAHQELSFKASGDDALHIWTQSIHGNWTEESYNSVKGRQMPDGTSILVAFGNFDADEIKAMQDGVRPPVSRSQALAREQAGL